MSISGEKTNIVINNYFKTECSVDTTIREAFEKGFRLGMKKVKAIENAQTIDAVEVVRCGECRHRDLFSCPLADNDFQKDDDYCSWGERRKDGE